MPITRRILATAASLAALCLAVPLASAQTQAYPNKPVTIVVPFAAGGGVDNITRLVSTEFGKRLGQTAVVDNRGGASGNIGSGLVARANPDGYTLLMGATFLALNKATMPNLHYDAVKDLIPVARVGQAPAVLVVSPSLPVDSVQDLVAYMRANEKTVSYGSVGYASPPHLLFTRHAGIRPTEILYKGGAAAMPDLMSGRLTFMIQTTSEVLPYIKSGKLKALAVTSAERFHALPEVPTMQQAGVTDLAWTGFWGLFAPAGTSPDIVQQLSDDMMAVVAMPEVAQSIAQLGIEAAPLPAAAFQEFFTQSVKEHEEVAKAFNIRIE